jgi:hypothetical protein
MRVVRVADFPLNGDLHAELITIDENLCREALSPAQETLAVARRKQIYEQLHPETVHGGDRKSSRQNGDLKSDRFTKATAAVTGRSERSVQRLVKRAQNIEPAALTRVVRTSLDKSGELDALAGLPADKQKPLIERASAGENVSARSPTAGDHSVPSAIWRAKFRKLMNEAPTKEDCEWAAEEARSSGNYFLDRRTPKP